METVTRKHELNTPTTTALPVRADLADDLVTAPVLARRSIPAERVEQALTAFIVRAEGEHFYRFDEEHHVPDETWV